MPNYRGNRVRLQIRPLRNVAGKSLGPRRWQLLMARLRMGQGRGPDEFTLAKYHRTLIGPDGSAPPLPAELTQTAVADPDRIGEPQRVRGLGGGDLESGRFLVNVQDF